MSAEDWAELAEKQAPVAETKAKPAAEHHRAQGSRWVFAEAGEGYRGQEAVACPG